MPAGRKSINVDFLNKLKDISGIERDTDFADKCGK